MTPVRILSTIRNIALINVPSTRSSHHRHDKGSLTRSNANLQRSSSAFVPTYTHAVSQPFISSLRTWQTLLLKNENLPTLKRKTTSLFLLVFLFFVREKPGESVWPLEKMSTRYSSKQYYSGREGKNNSVGMIELLSFPSFFCSCCCCCLACSMTTVLFATELAWLVHSGCLRHS